MGIAVMKSGLSLPIAGFCSSGLMTDPCERFRELILTLDEMGRAGIRCTAEDHKVVNTVVIEFQATGGR